MNRRPLVKLVRKISSTKSAITAAQPGQTLPGSLGTVQSVNGDGTATVIYNGTPIPCQCLGDFVPVVGQGVLVLVEGQRNWGIGPVSQQTPEWVTVGADGAPAFENGWASEALTDSGPPRFQLIGTKVYLQGGLAGGTILDAAFTLPSAYCPPYELNFWQRTSSVDEGCTVAVTAAGDVIPGAAADNGYVSLDGIVFDIT